MVARTSEDNEMVFCIQQMPCQGHMRQRDRFAELAAGTGILIEACSPFDQVSRTEVRSLTLRFSRELLPLRAAEITEACASNVDPATPFMQVLSGYLGRLFEVADDLTEPQRLNAGRAAIELLAMALRDVTPSGSGATSAEDVLLDMMRAHVRKHLADSHLHVDELARRHDVSVRHAYTLFARIGTTPGPRSHHLHPSGQRP
jgi:hypothetical protein